MTNNGDLPEIPIDTLAETENYTVWSAVEPDGETTYHVELGPVTVHFFTEEWQEFLEMIRDAAADNTGPANDDIEVELDWGTLFFSREEWTEFVSLVEQL